ncbi:hypothetical protein CDD82_5182 [Ophiocordyceps australis]|uniref:Uncharacterized protein n=1 Tax=Ophiocordyceps australis TaxID=1399860 RepID=A0A2C5YYW8_9HYPO|nr:hypothetical protein CDD82_5182 [Ophiocordyceps australis]
MSRQGEDINAIIHRIFTKPYIEVMESLPSSEKMQRGSQDEKNHALASRYYQSCLDMDHTKLGDRPFLDYMEEVHRAFAPLDSLRPLKENANVTTWMPALDTWEKIQPLDSYMIRIAQNAKVVVISPWTDMAILPAWWAERARPFWAKYRFYLSMFIDRAHTVHGHRVQDEAQIPEGLYELEEELLKLRLTDHELRRRKGNVQVMSLAKVGELAPTLFLDKTVESLGKSVGAMIERVEVVYPKTIKKIDGVVRESRREAVRTYMLWQAYQQTQQVWDMEWSKRWRMASYSSWGKPDNATLGQRCAARLKKHLGHIVDSFYTRHEYTGKHGDEAYIMATKLRDGWKTMVRTTDKWLGQESKAWTINKLDKLKISLGHGQYPDLTRADAIAKYYDKVDVYADANSSSMVDDRPHSVLSIRRPELWTHVHDYFRMEWWHFNRSWAGLLQTTDAARDEWPISATAQQVHYDARRNQLLVPAALMRAPLLVPEAPLYTQYSGLGVWIARGIMAAIDGIGQQYQADGTMAGQGWTAKELRGYQAIKKCFAWRWHTRIGPTGIVNDLTLDNSFETAAGDQEGMDVAYRAWLKTQLNQTDLGLPNFHGFSNAQLFFIARSHSYCGNLYGTNLREHLSVYSEAPLLTHRLAEPLWGYSPFERAFNCGCKRCALRRCRVFGQHMNKELTREEIEAW